MCFLHKWEETELSEDLHDELLIAKTRKCLKCGKTEGYKPLSFDWGIADHYSWQPLTDREAEIIDVGDWEEWVRRKYGSVTQLVRVPDS